MKIKIFLTSSAADYIVLEGSQDHKLERKLEAKKESVTEKTPAKKVAKKVTTKSVHVIKLEIYTVKMALPDVLDT